MKFSVLGVFLLLSFGARAQTPVGDFTTNEDKTITVKNPKISYGSKTYALSTTDKYSVNPIPEDNICSFLGLGASLNQFKSKVVNVLGAQATGEYHQTVAIQKNEFVLKEDRIVTIVEAITCLPKGESFVVGKQFSEKRILSDGSVYFANPKFEDGSKYIHFDSKSVGDGVCQILGFHRDVHVTTKFLKSLESGALVDAHGERIKDKKIQLYTIQAIASITCE